MDAHLLNTSAAKLLRINRRLILNDETVNILGGNVDSFTFYKHQTSSRARPLQLWQAAAVDMPAACGRCSEGPQIVVTSLG